MEEIILVDEKDNEVGIIEKIKAHEEGGNLHRAFSVFVFNSKKEMLIQKRAEGKYHFAGLWTNTCCSHPNKGETTEEAAHRKLKQEFGFDAELKEIFSFIYKHTDEKSGLTEWEYDHVLIGTFNDEPKPNPEEIDEYRWITLEELKKDVQENPEKYTPWFKIVLKRIEEFL